VVSIKRRGGFRTTKEKPVGWIDEKASSRKEGRVEEKGTSSVIQEKSDGQAYPKQKPRVRQKKGKETKLECGGRTRGVGFSKRPGLGKTIAFWGGDDNGWDMNEGCRNTSEKAWQGNRQRKEAERKSIRNGMLKNENASRAALGEERLAEKNCGKKKRGSKLENLKKKS